MAVTGWLLDIPILTSFAPRLSRLSMNTAFGFILIAVSLVFLNEEAPGPRPLIAGTCASIVLAVGVLSLSEYTFGTDFGIDRLLFPRGAVNPDAPLPFRMAPM